jgi:hypothetical protein
MRFISPTLHGILDYVVVVTFAAAPSLLGFGGSAAITCWTLAGVHLLVTVLTAFPLGIVRVLPFPLHGWIELVVAPALVAIPWVLGFAGDASPRTFFVAAGVVVGVVWAVTDYRAAAAGNAGRFSL